MLKKLFLAVLFTSSSLTAQDYFFKKFHPFNSDIPSPEAFLGYPIGEHHTRHDLIVAYLTKLAESLHNDDLHIGRAVERILRSRLFYSQTNLT